MRWTLLLLALMLSPLTAALSAAESPPRPPNGAWDIDLPVDGTTVQVRVRAPLEPTGPCPVIIFSHGLGGSREGYWLLTEAWASAGFVVIQPTHAGSDTKTFKDAGLLGLRSAARKAMTDPAVLTGRPLLVKRLIDLLPQIHAALLTTTRAGGSAPGFPCTFDATRIGVAGHSYGGWTTMAVAGVRSLLPGDLSDPRPRAFIAMSPPGPSPVQTPRDWEPATRPMLVMTGTEDRQAAFLSPDDGIDRGPEWRIRSYANLPPGDKFLAVLLGGHHCAFSNGQGARLSGEPQPEPWVAPCLAATTIAWWNAWLRDDAAALAAVRDGSTVPEGDRTKVRWERH